MLKSIVETIISAFVLEYFLDARTHWGLSFYVVIAPALFVVYYLAIPRLPKIRYWYLKNSRNLFPKIGLLNGQIESSRDHPCEKVAINIAPSAWKRALSSAVGRNKISFIRITDIDDSYRIIINPFGDNFPEEDTDLHVSFSRIQRYIANGGIFVVTGGAFFWHQNTQQSPNRKLPIKQVDANGRQALSESLLYAKFGVSPTGDSIDTSEPVSVATYQNKADQAICNISSSFDMSALKRFRAFLPQSHADFIPLLREINDVSFPVTLVRHGEGYLLHIGLFLDGEQSMEFRIVVDIVACLFHKNAEKLLQ